MLINSSKNVELLYFFASSFSLDRRVLLLIFCFNLASPVILTMQFDKNFTQKNNLAWKSCLHPGGDANMSSA